MNSIQMNRVEATLKSLHKDSEKDMFRMSKGIVKSVFRPMQPADFKEVYLPISKQQGKDLRQLIIDNDCKHVIEFGTSFGISTLYLADAVSQTGGKVVSTELVESKAHKAWENIQEANLQDFVDLKVGDAMVTLKKYFQNENKSADDPTVDFLFLDGWKDLYLPLFKMLEGHFKKGALIYADNVDMSGTREYTQYVLSKKDKYSSQFTHGNKGLLSRVI